MYVWFGPELQHICCLPGLKWARIKLTAQLSAVFLYPLLSFQNQSHGNKNTDNTYGCYVNAFTEQSVEHSINEIINFEG